MKITPAEDMVKKEMKTLKNKGVVNLTKVELDRLITLICKKLGV